MKKLLVTVVILGLIIGGAYYFITNMPEEHSHELGEWYFTVEPTCTRDGVEERKCECGYSVKKTVDALGHKYEKSESVEPTCTEKGYDTLVCSGCGDSIQDNVTDAKGHSFGEWLTANEPTCTAEGKKERACDCGYSESELIPVISHVYETVETVAPSCTEKGYDMTVCSSCGDAQKINFTELVEHTFGKWITVTESTCTSKGERERLCACGARETESSPLIDHAYAVTETVAPDCTEKGYDILVCTMCGGEIKGNEKEALGHTFLRGECVRCKEEIRCPEPMITTAPGQKIKVGENFTVAWQPVSAEMANIVYELYVMNDGRPETKQKIGIMTGTIFVISKLYFDKADSYVIYVVATDTNENYKDSNEVSIILSVEPVPPEDTNDYRDVDRYSNNYYYEYIGTLANGKGLQAFYKAVDEMVTAFHDDRSADAPLVRYTEEYSFYKLGSVEFREYGITADEAVSVFWLYIMDHPLYYWISNNFLYNNVEAEILVHDSYADGDVRCDYNNIIYNGVEKIMQNVRGVTSSYLVALSHYETVVKGADYAYEPSDGITPENADWAHSILGFFDGGKGVVCEGFAETFSLLLNFSNIENILIDGYSNRAAHSWNLVRMDDGEFYWCDPTWDDAEMSPIGYDYKYFCVNDKQNVWYYQNKDGENNGRRNESFTDNHSVDWFEVSIDMSGAIPPRAVDSYSGTADELIMRKTFSVDGMTYAVTGYRKVQLVKIDKTGDVMIPETVYYNGMAYTVISIGSIYDDGAFGCDSVLNKDVRSIFIPKTVRYIWIKNDLRHALYSLYLEAVAVDEANEFYETDNGILKNKENG